METLSVLSTGSFLFVVMLGYIISSDRGEADTEAAAWNAPSPRPDRIVLTWREDPATTQSVSWRTDTTITEAVAQVALSAAAPAFSERAKTVKAETQLVTGEKVQYDNPPAHFHSATFTGLMPDTLYAYRVGNGKRRWSEWFQFRTASREPEPFSFIYLGDAQDRLFSHWSRTLRAAYSEAPEARFMIHSGDLVGDGHADIDWHKWFKAGGWIQSVMPSIPVPGNHDVEGYTEELDEQHKRHLAIYWRPQFELPTHGVEGMEETVFYIDYQGVRIIGLNSTRRLKAQAQWLEKVLADNPNPWTVVTFHHPIFSSAENRNRRRQRAMWKPIFDKYQVDLVLQGHDHTYARGQVRNVRSGLNTQAPRSGTVYVNSVSGVKMYNLKEKRWSEYSEEGYGIELERAAENTQLYQIVRVQGDTLKFRAYTVTGRVYDAFDLIKQQEGEPTRMVVRDGLMPERTHENTIEYKKPWKLQR